MMEEKLIYYSNGIVKYREFYENELLHNLTGPAVLFYTETGELFCRHYYIRGIQFYRCWFYELMYDLKVKIEDPCKSFLDRELLVKVLKRKKPELVAKL